MEPKLQDVRRILLRSSGFETDSSLHPADSLWGYATVSLCHDNAVTRGAIRSLDV